MAEQNFESGEYKLSAEQRQRKARPSARRVYFDPSTPTARTIVRIVVITLLIWTVWNFGGTILSSLTHLFFMIILSVFFAYLIEPLVRLIRRPFEERHIERFFPRPAAIGVAYLLLFGGIGLAVWFLAPLVSEQAQQLSANFGTYSQSAKTRFEDLNGRLGLNRLPQQVRDDISNKIGTGATEFVASLTAFLLVVVTYVPWLILIPILAFFFLKDAHLFRILILRLFPSGMWRGRAESLIHDANTTLAAYTRAQLISCTLIGTICTLGFYLFGVNYALLLGVLAGVFEFVPLIGPLTIGAAATIIAGIESPSKALYVALFLIVLRISQDYVIYPRIVRGGIHLHPLAIILSVLAGEEIAGIAGVFISIPVVALLTVLHRHILEHSGSSGILSGFLEPKKDEIQARGIEHLPIEDAPKTT